MENNEEFNEVINEIMKNENNFDNIDLTNSFDYILRMYDEVSRQTNNVNKNNWEKVHKDFFNFFIYQFPGYLKELSQEVSDEFVISKSYTYAKLLVLPYLAFSFSDNDDFLIYYLFSYDLSEIYLILGLKVEGKEIDITLTKNKFKRLIKERCDEKNDLNFKIIDDGSINLKVREIYEKIELGQIDSSSLPEGEKDRLKRQLETAENYENAAVFSKRYEKNNLPDNETLKKDLYEFLNLYKFINEEKIFDKIKDFEFKRNLIYFGAPGTGKSFKLEEDKNCLINNDDYFERVTFHPDYSYANFVGTYKPVSTENNDIKYKYVSGPFMRILKKAIQEENKDNDYLLIIEEINRANIAAVFGDVFQLLDRDEKNYSRYEINLSEEAADELGEVKIKIPQNMYIWATMNSADQGVFPMDTAFKRRWNFNYLDINNNQKLISNLKFKLNNKYYYWNTLRKAINHELLKENINEDKLLGPFFAFNEYIGEEYIPPLEFKETFKNKVLMYLFEDVLKSRSNKFFSGIGDRNLTFGDLCRKFDENGLGIFSEYISKCKEIEVNDSNEESNED